MIMEQANACFRKDARMANSVEKAASAIVETAEKTLSGAIEQTISTLTGQGSNSAGGSAPSSNNGSKK
jgi:hypothetical protein